MFTDTTFNSLETVLATLYQSFVETAKRMHCYLRELAAETAIRPSLVTGMSSREFAEIRRGWECALIDQCQTRSTALWAWPLAWPRIRNARETYRNTDAPFGESKWSGELFVFPCPCPSANARQGE